MSDPDDVTRVVRREPPQPGDRDDGGGGRGWMLATVALIALALGVGAGLLLAGDDDKTRTVRGTVRTVTVAQTAPPATTSLGVTVTQPVQTVTAPAETVTVTVPSTDAATEPEG